MQTAEEAVPTEQTTPGAPPDPAQTPAPTMEPTLATEKEKAVPPLSPARIEEAGYNRNVFCVTAAEGLSPEEICDQNYWQHVSQMLKPGDHIEVVDETYQFYLELIVLAADRLWAHVAIINEVDLSPFHGQDIKIDARHYEVKFAGAHYKWRVFYKKDIIKQGFATEGLARRWAVNHAAALER